MADTGGSERDGLDTVRWLTVPGLAGFARLRMAARLLDCSVFGFAVESAERILLPYTYTVEFHDRDFRGQASAAWCHLVSHLRYRAGFELTQLTTPAGRRLLRYMEALVRPEGRRNRRLSSDPNTELHLETVAPCRTVAIANEPPRLRIECELLPTLESRIWLEIHAAAAVVDLRGRVSGIVGLRRKSALRHTLEIDVAEHTYDQLAQRLDG